MNYVLIEYDGCDLKVRDNGKVVDNPLEERNEFENNSNFRQWLKEKYKDYDLIVFYCFGFEIIKDITKESNEAQWIGILYDGYADGQPVFDIFECSNCKEEYYTDDVKQLPNYCPNCGRKMRVEKN